MGMTQAHGGFDWPVVYSLNQKRVLEDLKQGRIQYADLSQWSFVDEFLCFILQSEFLKFADRTYPNPRKKVTVQFESAGYVDFMVAREALLAVP